ncbi:MAG: hypothetical protein L3J39_09915 [Verrucomicrobiales bacterium]|nr:hypothetical protein [Verrucomicrobiales bacterium]
MDNLQQEDPLEKCAFSGEERPRSKMLQYGEKFIAPEFKEQFVQLLSEGGVKNPDDLDCEFVTSLFLSDILRQSLVIWKAQWKEILLMFVMIWIPLELAAEYIAYNIEGDDWASIGTGVRLENNMEIWIGSLVTGAIIALTGKRWRGGGQVSFSGTWSLGMTHYGRLLGTKIIFGLAFILVLIPFVILYFVLLEYWMATVGIAIIGFLFLCFLFVRFGLSDPAAIGRKEGGIPALQASWNVTKGHFWRVAGFQLFVFSVLIVLSAPFYLLTMIPFLDHFVISALLAVVSGVILTFGTVETTVLYEHLVANCHEGSEKNRDSKVSSKL